MTKHLVEWDLPDSQLLTLSVDPAGVESVWLGPRLLSRSPPGGRAEGHALSIASAQGTSVFDVLVRFDRARGGVLRIDGQERAPNGISPADEASAAEIASDARGTRAGGLLLVAMGIGFGLYGWSIVAAVLAHEARVTWSMKILLVGPVSFVAGLGMLFAPKNLAAQMEQARISGKYGGGVLAYSLLLVVVGLGAALALNQWVQRLLLENGYYLTR